MPVRLGLSVHDAAAIWMEHLTGHVGGIFRSEKHKTGGDFVGLTRASQRCIGTECRDFIGGESRWNQRRPDWARSGGVFPNLLVRSRFVSLSSRCSLK